MSDLINALLNYSRLSHPEDNFIKTDLNDIAKKVISDFDIVIHEKNALITLDKLPTVDAIPLQINQLFHNLISNSLKFSRNGVTPEVRISSRLLSAEEVEEKGLNENTTYCQIIVKDNGIGFEQEYAEKIFIIFQRLNGKQEYKGTGIGLAICKKIVDTHRGRIFAEGKEGIGAAFNIILPIKQLPRTI
jgi:two-component system, chemotaxis family, CheB/CheR fusion protein